MGDDRAAAAEVAGRAAGGRPAGDQRHPVTAPDSGAVAEPRPASRRRAPGRHASPGPPRSLYSSSCRLLRCVACITTRWRIAMPSAEGGAHPISTGCQRRMAPKDFPPVSTVQRHFYAWCDGGAWRHMQCSRRQTDKPLVVFVSHQIG